MVPPVGSIQPTKFVEGIVRNLANPLCRHSELLADFVERMDLAIVESEAESDDVLVALGELVQQSLAHHGVE